jgi:hypothetical protein
LSTGRVFFMCSVGQVDSRPRALKSYILYINQHSFVKDVPLGGLSNIFSSHGELSPKTPNSGTSLGISSLNVFGHVSAQLRPG